VNNDGYAVALEKRNIYVALRDAAAEEFFRSIGLPQAVRRAVLAA
jgi:hypothetical protein